jgi:hypothetical protein
MVYREIREHFQDAALEARQHLRPYRAALGPSVNPRYPESRHGP